MYAYSCTRDEVAVVLRRCSTTANRALHSIDRTKRVKDARSEAQKEIEDYRKQKDDEFKAFEKEVCHIRGVVGLIANTCGTQHSSGNKAAEEQAEKDTQKQLEEIKAIGKKTGPKVVEDLIGAVLTVRPEVPNRMEGSETAA